MGQTIGENEPVRSFVDKLLRDKQECELEEAALDLWELYKEKYTPVGGQSLSYKDNRQYFTDGFTNGAKHMEPRIKELEGKLEIARNALSKIGVDDYTVFYGLGVLTDAWRDKTFLMNRIAKEALEKIGEGK